MGCLKGGTVAGVVIPTPDYVGFATHYPFAPDFCHPADPESKGNVENLVGYAKTDLVLPDSDDLTVLNNACRETGAPRSVWPLVAVEGDPTDRRPRLGDDAVLGAERLRLSLLEIGMALDLVDVRHHGGPLEEPREMVDHEVADPDGANLAVAEERLKRPVGVDGQVEPAGEGLVEDEEVDLVDAELAGALVEGVQRLVVAVVADPDLGLDEHVVTVDAAALDGVADAAFVGVGGGGVDVPVADA